MHQFDVIVQALSNDTLSEDARADFHYDEDGNPDGYFQQTVPIISASWKEGVTVDDVSICFKIFEDGELYNNEDTVDEDEGKIAELTTMINQNGVEMPAMLNPDPDDSGCEDYYVYVGTHTITKATNTLVSIQYVLNDDEEIDYEGTPEMKVDDVFVEINYNDDNIPIMYKEDINVFGFDSVDYGDIFVYDGDYVIDGIVYNKWYKDEENKSNDYGPTHRILTQQIVVNNKFIVSKEEFKNAIQSVSTVYDKWQSYEFGEWTDYYMLTENYVNASIIGYKLKAISAPSHWKLKYCLDNDTSRFAWALNEQAITNLESVQAISGKGVIYWMRDEFDNECPYDFKNIQFPRNGNWCYTFGGFIDRSNINEYLNTYRSNSIGRLHQGIGCISNYKLPKILFLVIHSVYPKKTLFGNL